jgi:hypothetical protein
LVTGVAVHPSASDWLIFSPLNVLSLGSVPRNDGPVLRAVLPTLLLFVFAQL